jgi:DNA-binding transcriptional regulator YiaG
MHWHGAAVSLLNAHECHAPSLLVQKVHSMSFNCTDEEIFAASLRARFPNHAEQVISETDLPIRTIASSIYPTTAGSIDSIPATKIGPPEPSQLLSREEWPPSMRRVTRSTSEAFASESAQKTRDLSTQEVVGAVRSLRQRLCFTQRGFAEKLGISPRTLQDWEQGRRQPSGPAKTLLQHGLKELDPDRLT